MNETVDTRLAAQARITAARQALEQTPEYHALNQATRDFWAMGVPVYGSRVQPTLENPTGE
jgi:hypothetical protein